MKYYISSKDWKTICETFESIKKEIFVYVDAHSLDLTHENEVGFNILKKEFLTILSINNIGVVEK